MNGTPPDRVRESPTVADPPSAASIGSDAVKARVNTMNAYRRVLPLIPVAGCARSAVNGTAELLVVQALPTLPAPAMVLPACESTRMSTW